MTKERIIQYIGISITWLILLAIFVIPNFFIFWGSHFNVFELGKQVIFRLFTSLIIILYLAKILLTRQFLLVKNKYLFFSIGLLLFIFLLNIIGSMSPSYSLWGSYFRQQGILSFVYYLLFFIVTILHWQKKDLPKFIWATIFASIPVCVYGLLQYLRLDPLSWSMPVAGRIISTIGQPNFLAYYLILVVPLTVYGVIHLSKNWLSRSGLILLVVGQLLCISLTYSRGAWLGLIAGAIVAGILWLVDKRHIRWLSYIAVSLVVVIVIMAINWQTFSNLAQRADQAITNPVATRFLSIFYPDQGSGQIRTKYWQVAWQAFAKSSWQRQLLGYGKETQENIFAQYYAPEFGLYEVVDTFPDRAHNSILDMLLEFGVVGLLVFGIFNGYIIWQAFRYWRSKQPHSPLLFWSLCSLATVGTANLFSFSITVHYFSWYVLLAMIVIVVSEKRTIHLPAWQTISYVALWLAVSIFVIIFWLLGGWRYYVADMYSTNARRALMQNNCQSALSNVQQAVITQPLSLYYKTQAIEINNKCWFALSKDMRHEVLQKNSLEQITSATFYNVGFLSATANAYTLFGYDINADYYPLADESFQNLIALAPFVSQTYLDYGQFKIWSGEYEQALTILQKGMSVLPQINEQSSVDGAYYESLVRERLAQFWEKLGDAYFNLQDYEQALVYYHKIELGFPYYVSINKKIADVYYFQHNLERAIYYNEKALRFDGQNYQWSYNLALLYQELGDIQRAQLYAEQAQKLQPDNELIKTLVEQLK